jgi:hypothetical protein
LVEQPIRNRQVSGSSPLVGSNISPNIHMALTRFKSCRSDLLMPISVWNRHFALRRQEAMRMSVGA